MIRVIVTYKDDTTRQYLPSNWAQIMSIYTHQNIALLTIYAITPREEQEFQKKINAQNLDFMRVVR